jgi:hypothetical protein
MQTAYSDAYIAAVLAISQGKAHLASCYIGKHVNGRSNGYLLIPKKVMGLNDDSGELNPWICDSIVLEKKLRRQGHLVVVELLPIVGNLEHDEIVSVHYSIYGLHWDRKNGKRKMIMPSPAYSERDSQLIELKVLRKEDGHIEFEPLDEE